MGVQSYIRGISFGEKGDLKGQYSDSRYKGYSSFYAHGNHVYDKEGKALKSQVSKNLGFLNDGVDKPETENKE